MFACGVLGLSREGHHRAACACAGVLRGRGFAVENVAAHICREGREESPPTSWCLTWIWPDWMCMSRLEVVVDGLSIFWGVQLAVDTTVVSALHANGEARRNAASSRDGVVLEAANGMSAHTRN